MFFAIIVIVIAIDQFTKYLVSANYVVGQSIPLYKDLVYLTSVRNTGAAYNILQDHTRLLTYAVMVILGLVLLYVLIAWKGLSKTTRTAFAMILGGGTANLIDRYFLGYVVDFIDVRIIPVFNFADIMICIGCGLLILDVLIIEPIQNAVRKGREKKAKKLAEKEAKAAEEAKAAAEAKASEEALQKAEAAQTAEAPKEAETVAPAPAADTPPVEPMPAAEAPAAEASAEPSAENPAVEEAAPLAEAVPVSDDSAKWQ